MNPPKFLVSKMEKDKQRLIDEVYKVLDVIGVSPQENMELSAYQLKDVAQVWYELWKGERPVGTELVEWEVFKLTLLIDYFP